MSGASRLWVTFQVQQSFTQVTETFIERFGPDPATASQLEQALCMTHTRTKELLKQVLCNNKIIGNRRQLDPLCKDNADELESDVHTARRALHATAQHSRLPQAPIHNASV
jgi:hypothetical protein